MKERILKKIDESLSGNVQQSDIKKDS